MVDVQVVDAAKGATCETLPQAHSHGHCWGAPMTRGSVRMIAEKGHPQTALLRRPLLNNCG